MKLISIQVLFFLLIIIFSSCESEATGESFTDILIPDVFEYHLADDEIDLDWVTYLPSLADRDNLNIIMIRPSFVETSYYDQSPEERYDPDGAWYYSWPYDDYLILSPLLYKREEPWLNAPYFPEEAFDQSIAEEFYRFDIDICLMIDRIIYWLNESGYTISEKVFIEGFSGGAIFAQKMTLLHPSRIAAVSLGQCGGSLSLPIIEYENTSLDWPAGVKNFFELTGKTFNNDAYKEIHQFIFIGTDDTESSIFRNPGELFTQDMIDNFNLWFGEADPVRLKNQCVFLQSIEYSNIIFTMYDDIGHDYGSMDDVYAFFDNIRSDM